MSSATRRASQHSNHHGEHACHPDDPGVENAASPLGVIVSSAVGTPALRACRPRLRARTVCLSPYIQAGGVGDGAVVSYALSFEMLPAPVLGAVDTPVEPPMDEAPKEALLMFRARRPVVSAHGPSVGRVESSGATAGSGGGTGGGGGGRSGPTACQSVGCGRVRGGGMYVAGSR